MVRPLLQKDGGITLWAAVQSPFAQQAMLSDWLDVPKEKVRVIAPYLGGGFWQQGRGDQWKLSLWLWR